MSHQLLNGQVDDSQTVIAGLRAQLREANEALGAERAKAGQAEAGVKELKRLLDPFRRAIGVIYGEIDAMGIQDAPTQSSSGQSNPKWEMWKKRFPGRGSELIDLLLVHEQMNTKQLSVALKCDPRTLAQLIFKMKPVISKNGGLYSLQNI